MAAEQGVEVDREGFTALMNAQRERARADGRVRKSGGAVDTTALWRGHSPCDESLHAIGAAGVGVSCGPAGGRR